MPQQNQLTHQKPGFSNPNATTKPTHPPETGFLKSQCHNKTNSPTRNRVSQIPMPQQNQLTHQKPGFLNPNAATKPTHPPETRVSQIPMPQQNQLTHQKPGFSNPNATTKPTHPPETGFLKSQWVQQNQLTHQKPGFLNPHGYQLKQLTHQKPGFSNPKATTKPTHPPETGFLKSQCHNKTNSPTRNRVSQIPMPQQNQLTHQKPGFSNPNATTKPTHPPETGFLNRFSCPTRNRVSGSPTYLS